jgi:hypothetical protein
VRAITQIDSINEKIALMGCLYASPNSIDHDVY